MSCKRRQVLGSFDFTCWYLLHHCNSRQQFWVKCNLVPSILVTSKQSESTKMYLLAIFCTPAEANYHQYKWELRINVCFSALARITRVVYSWTLSIYVWTHFNSFLFFIFVWESVPGLCTFCIGETAFVLILFILCVISNDAWKHWASVICQPNPFLTKNYNQMWVK